MKKRALLSVMVLFASTVLWAVPVKKNVNRSVVLEDGTAIVVTLAGDEYAHWWEDAGGNIYTVDADGNAAKMSASEFEAMKAKGNSRKAARNASRQKRIARKSADKTKYTGTKHGLVILVNFLNKSLTSSAAQADFDDMFNKEGYSENGHIGSVADYFHDQSYGQLDIVFDVAGPVTVSQNYAYYGQNDRWYGQDTYPCTMVTEACRLVDDMVDFSLYDWTGDGEVDQVFIVYAGYGENAGGGDDTIWPHEWALSEGKAYGDGEGAITLDGVTIDTYAVTCELSGSRGSVLAGIGTACHEFSHCLGYPDFYDTSYSGGWGMQAWDLLDYGAYNGPQGIGEVPAGYTAYERWQAGWLEPTALSDGMEVDSLQPLGSSPDAYILYNDNYPDEYYILENRQADRWFSYVDEYSAPSGMLVTHVDYDKTAWESNLPNNDANHQRMTVIQANNQKGTYSSQYSSYSITKSQYAGHLYPYNANDSLTRYSTPAATLYNANTDGTKYMDKGIYDVKKNADGTMSFSCGSKTVADEGDDGEYGDGEDGEDDTEQTEQPSGDVVFYESFDQCNGRGGNDGKWSNIMTVAELLPDNDGWVSSNGYGAYKCARFGTSTYAGTVDSPAFTLYGDAELTFKIGAWDNRTERNTVDVYYDAVRIKYLTVSKGDWTEVSIPISGSGTMGVSFIGDGRFFLDEVKVTKTAADGIKDVSVSAKTPGRVYSISGQYLGTDVNAMPAGVYIVNNKKVIRK